MPHNPIKSIQLHMHSIDGVTPPMGTPPGGAPHSPIKSLKVDFHGIDGVTPKPQQPTGGTMTQERSPQPQSKLSPLEEVLFKHWATANGVQDPDATDNHYDFRGMYQQSGGLIHPHGALQGASDSYNRLMQKPPIESMLSQDQSQGQPQDQAQSPDQDQEPIRQLLNMIHGGQ